VERGREGARLPGFLKAVAPDHGSRVADSLKIG
jgi:hypothetical protein